MSKIKANPLFNADEEEMRIKAFENLEQMKELESKNKNKLITIRLKNGVIVKSTNENVIKEYEQRYGKL